MERGLEVDIHLTPGLQNENFVAQALGNLAAHRLQSERGEPLQWQVLRVEEGHHHHFRLVVRHPTRALDIGLHHQLKRTLEELSRESETELEARYHRAVKEGLKPQPLRHLREAPDLWQDDFWKWFG